VFTIHDNKEMIESFCEINVLFYLPATALCEYYSVRIDG